VIEYCYIVLERIQLVVHRPPVFEVGLSESSDGLYRHNRGQVLGAGEPDVFDALGIGARCVLRHQGR
jgi:hypothetical protein